MPDDCGVAYIVFHYHRGRPTRRLPRAGQTADAALQSNFEMRHVIRCRDFADQVAQQGWLNLGALVESLSASRGGVLAGRGIENHLVVVAGRKRNRSGHSCLYPVQSRACGPSQQKEM
jgi:hypothetical protein